jgi:hypothetical protein
MFQGNSSSIGVQSRNNGGAGARESAWRLALAWPRDDASVETQFENWIVDGLLTLG